MSMTGRDYDDNKRPCERVVNLIEMMTEHQSRARRSLKYIACLYSFSTALRYRIRSKFSKPESIVQNSTADSTAGPRMISREGTCIWLPNNASMGTWVYGVYFWLTDSTLLSESNQQYASRAAMIKNINNSTLKQRVPPWWHWSGIYG